MKSIANYMDIYVWSSKFVDTLNHISAAKVFFFMHQWFLKLHIFTSNYSVNTNISYGSPVKFLWV